MRWGIVTTLADTSRGATMKYFWIFLVAFALSGCSEHESGGSVAGGGGSPGEDLDNEADESPSRAIPDIDSMTLAFERQNIRARNTAGVETDVTVYVADNLNDDTVADGATVNFATEAGRISPSCEISGGECTVTWNSQLPVAGDGRVTVVAWMTGTESFKDLNANGLFDDGDLFDDDPSRPDISEPFVNDNMVTLDDDTLPAYFTDDGLNNVTLDTQRDNNEVFIDTPGLTDNAFDAADGLYSGADCAHSTLCAEQQQLFIWRDGEIIISGAEPSVRVYDASAADDDRSAEVTGTVDVTGGPVKLRFEITDDFMNILPQGTTIEFSTTDLAEVDASFVVGSSAFPRPYFVTAAADDTPGGGSVELTVNVPAESGTGQVALERTFTVPVTD